MSELALKLIAENKRTKAPFLDLGNCGLTYLPEELFECKEWLTGLNLGSMYFDFENDEWVETKNDLGNNIFIGKKLESISQLKRLQSLYLSYNKISDISYLSNLIELQTLDLSSNKISDIRYLSNLIGLQSLYLSSNKISDIRVCFEIITC